MHVSSRAREAETWARRAVCWDVREGRVEGDMDVVDVDVDVGGSGSGEEKGGREVVVVVERVGVVVVVGLEG